VHTTLACAEKGIMLSGSSYPRYCEQKTTVCMFVPPTKGSGELKQHKMQVKHSRYMQDLASSIGHLQAISVERDEIAS
jgi:hypothetical protein